jgi:hypothetical protein
MAGFVRKSPKRTYHCIGWTLRDPQAGAFRDVALPGFGIIRVMDKAVHQAALERAEQRLVELERRVPRTPHD